jgi:hypothetical protein
MIDRSDLQGRLRLFRYGLIVVVIVTFLISLVAPMISLNGVVTSAGLPALGIGDFLGSAILFTVIVAVIAVVAYAVYHYMLTKSWPFMGGSKTS